MEVTSELLARHDRPGPRYTSYPTAIEFHDGVGPDDYARHLTAAAAVGDEPMSLYVHLPFCDSRCDFCGCHVVVARRPEVADAYLPAWCAKPTWSPNGWAGAAASPRSTSVAALPPTTAPTTWPTSTSSSWPASPSTPAPRWRSRSIPGSPPQSTCDTLHVLGFNRVSMGVQDTDEQVQDLIGRNQSWEQTRDTFEAVRDLGSASINIDLIYGLPGQSEASFATTLEQVIALGPDRLAVYSFAYVPWVRRHQRRIDPDSLPERDLKFSLLARAMAELGAAGYERIGMDHFALPTDELARARAGGTLARTFMGYTVMTVEDVIGLGSSAIGDVQGAYVQDHRRLASYLADVDAGVLPVERGVVLTEDDRVRRTVITALMCNDVCAYTPIEERFGISFSDTFAEELAELARPGGLVEEGFVTVDADAVRATELGSLFIRNVAMVFDRYRRPGCRGCR